MTTVNRWLLPDGIEEILPGEGRRVENLRRELLDLFQRWGYDLVQPPMAEFTESLLTGIGHDLDLLTCKITDQISGRMMGIRADMTPQVARMDAHSFQREGVNRFCYTGHVLHTRPKTPLATRAPLQIGVELFGEKSLNADLEVMSLLLETLAKAQLPKLYFAVGHVGLYRGLAQAAGLSTEQENDFFELLQTKAITDIQTWISAHIESPKCAQWLSILPTLSGNQSVLAKAHREFEAAPEAVLKALDDLDTVAEVIAERYPGVDLYFDLSELRGYHYHTGVVFAAFADGMGEAIANGGRYDDIGQAFGRARPATGFAADLVALQRLDTTTNVEKSEEAIYVLMDGSKEQWDAIQNLRSQGERVICGFQSAAAQLSSSCTRELLKVNKSYVVQPVMTEASS